MSTFGMTRDWLGPVPRPAHRPRKEWWGPWHPIPNFADYAKRVDTALCVIDALNEPIPFLEEGAWTKDGGIFNTTP